MIMSDTSTPPTGTSKKNDRLFPGERERTPVHTLRPDKPTLAGSTSRVDLSGVPQALLWSLWNRAAESGRSKRLIEDPLSAELVEQLDYDFERNFDKPTVFHAICARVCDDLIFDYLLRVPNNAVVVALGEGLETQLWRIGESRIHWISVDLPEAIIARQSFLPSQADDSLVKCSALDPAWMDAVPQNAAPFINAAGLLMYFEANEVRKLLSQIAERFPGAEIFFDTITPYQSARTIQGQQLTPNYTAPPMPWGITQDDLPDFLADIPGIEPLKVQTYADPFPDRTRLYRLLSRIAPLRRRYAACLVHAKVQV